MKRAMLAVLAIGFVAALAPVNVSAQQKPWELYVMQGSFPGTSAVKQPILGVANYKAVLDKESNGYIKSYDVSANTLKLFEESLMQFLNYYMVDIDPATVALTTWSRIFETQKQVYIYVLDSGRSPVAFIALTIFRWSEYIPGKSDELSIVYRFFK